MEGMDFDREVLSRLPLAEAALLVLRQACSREDSREVFQRCRERCFENRLKFETFVDVLKDALLRFDGSARRACEQAREHRRLPVSDPAFYSKLRHLPIGLSEVFLADSSARLAPLLPDALPSPLPPSLRRFNVQILDGKVTKRVAKRLKILRGLAGGALGGKALVTLHYNSGLVFAMSGSPDGDANDASLVEDLVKQVLARLKTEEIILWIGDAQFADLTQTYRFRGPANKHHFLLRYSHSTKFVPDELAPEALEHPGLLEGTDQQGRTFKQEWGYLGAKTNKKRMWLRRIILVRPGEKPVMVVTSLLDPVAYPAEELLEAYLARGTIEGVFQKITEVFSLKRLISSSPKGTVFQLAFCLLLFNVIVVLCSHLAAGQELKLKEVSQEMVFEDVKEELIALSRVLDPLDDGQEEALPALPAEASSEPELQSPPNAAPEVKAAALPENAQPENAQPENAQPENAQPESAQPENAQPESALPESGVPEGRQKGGSKSGRRKGSAAGCAGEALVPWSGRLAELIPEGKSPAEVRQRLVFLLKGRWRTIWLKRLNKKRRPHPDKPRARVHSCVHRILLDHQKNSPLTT